MREDFVPYLIDNGDRWMARAKASSPEHAALEVLPKLIAVCPPDADFVRGVLVRDETRGRRTYVRAVFQVRGRARGERYNERV